MAKASRRNGKKSLLELTCDEMERRLAAPGEDPELRAYFGDDVYVDLKSKVREQRATRAARITGPRVLILHGIMGSLLGRPRWGWDAIWLNPVAIAQGQLSKLSLSRPPGTTDVKTLGVLPLYYAALRVWLRAVGMNADFFPYDWRQSVEVLGRQLEATLAQDAAASISLVAHSMGGLVSRAAVKLNGSGIQKVHRIVMLGTPNFGSFVPAQVLCVQYPFVNKVIALDVTQTNDNLTRHVFSSFPSLYQMLPSPAAGRYEQQDMFDRKHWPRKIPKLDTGLLRASRKIQADLPVDDPRFRLIAGVDQETVTSVGPGSEQTFDFFTTNEGDGTVPLFLAQLTDHTPTWYVKENHGGLPRNRQVVDAVIDILTSADGQTSVLPDRWMATRAAATTRRKLVVRSTSEKRDVSQLTRADQQELLETVFGPRIVSTAVLPTLPTPPGNGDDRRQQFGGIVVGRRQRRLEIVLAQGSIADVPASAHVLGLFEGVTPTGAADALDRRTNGLIRDFYTRHVIDGALGKVSLVPTNCTALMSGLVAFIGLGPFGDFTPDRQLVGAASVVKTLIKLRIPDFATVLMGETMSAREGAEDRGAFEALRQLLKGFLAGLRDSDSEHLLRRIVFCVYDPQKYEALKGEFYGLAATKLFEGIELVFDEMKVTPLVQDRGPEDRRTATAGLPGEDDSPSYLMTTDYSLDPKQAGFKFAFLTASGRGSLPSASATIDRKQLEALLNQFDPDVGLRSAEDLKRLGDQLARLLFPDEFITQLAALEDIQEGRPLRLVHDAATSKIPWEALRIADDYPALSRIVSRHFLGDDALRKVSEDRLLGESLDVLMVVDPSNNLPGAREEAKTIMHLMGKVSGLNLVVRTGAEGTHAQIKQDFCSGQFDIVHYAGHAGFDPIHTQRRGLLCSDGNFLTGDDLTDMSTLPTLVFLNACQSARIRRAQAHPTDPVFNLTRRQQMKQTVSVAEAFLRGGLKLFLGTYWPVGDDAAKTFSSVFYEHIIQQQAIGVAVHKARVAVQQQGDIDWADYMLYGDARFALKQSRE